MKETNKNNELIEWIKVIGIGIVLALIINVAFTRIDVNGISMMPTLQDDERVIVNKVKPLYSDYKRFDVIVFEQDEHTKYVKRIIGIPGDHIAYENDQLYINGIKYDEPYLDEYKNELTDNAPLTADFKMGETLGEDTVPEGYYFVLGDNRRYSIDSRDPNVGFVSEDVIMGSTNLVLWPFRTIK